MKIRKLFMTLLLSLGVSAGVLAGVANYRSVQVTDAVAATNGSATKLIIQDSLGWNFRSLCLHTFTFADGYTKADLDSYLKTTYVTKAASDSAIKESSTKSYTTGSTYVYINAGGTSKTREHLIPGWVLDYEIEVHNNSNAFKHGKLSATWQHSGHSSTTTTNKNGTALGKVLTMNCASHWGQNSSYASLTNTAQYFGTATITKKYVAGSTEIKTATTESVYLNYKYTPAASEAIDGYSNNGKWYTNSACTTEYSPTLITGATTLYASYSSIQYKVSEYNVFDGVAEATPFSTATVDPHYTTEQVAKEGYVSKGIYLDAAGKTPYTGVLTGDTSLYHLYESEQYVNVYLQGFDGDKWGENVKFYLYVWNKTEDILLNGTWPGNELVLDNYVANGINFNERGLYKVSILANGEAAPTHFIITSSNGDYSEENKNKQSADLTVTDGAYYESNSLISGATEGLSGDLSLGAQAALVWDINEARLAAGLYTYNQVEYANSICAIDSATVDSLLAKYDSLEETDKFDNTKFFTNDVDDRREDDEFVNDQADYYGYEVIESLRAIQNTRTNELNKFITIDGSNPATLIVIIILSVSVSTLGLYIVVKRKKR